MWPYNWSPTMPTAGSAPYLSFLCYGDRPLAVRYRVTLLQPVTR